jgi:hypothetical protein
MRRLPQEHFHGERVLMIKKEGQGGPPPMPSVELDEEAWQRVAAGLIAANRGDASTFSRLLRRFDSGLSAQSRIESYNYLAFFLRYRVAEILGRRPTAEDLHDLAVQAYRKYAKVIRAPAPAVMLEDTLRAVFLMPPTGPQESGPTLFVSGVAAAGVLFDDPSHDLTALRPPLAEWRSRNLAQWRSEAE